VDRIRNPEDIRHLQRFFYERRERVMPSHRRRLCAGAGIQKFYDERIGRADDQPVG
jgi:hypothetical protein